ncbi:hypothetical protein GJ700_27620 [Duganella sp. FT92W]|uniref:DUF3995 domain-containing protein n=1 Tax=Pseudoduganella rivuli TaxID=2666085 RepID=A0A7X2LUB9_9BURK|nr:hypothetical protein [Pseudoduganella rivuli]MRV75495.1 hypothetical protein [Pseudoduganella rivuli]
MQYNRYLLAAAAASGTVAFLHLLCLVFGASWYRFLGAGERFAQLAAAGNFVPVAITVGIAALLSLWSAYALAGAGVIRKLPYTRLVLCLIAAFYCFRGLAFPSLIFFFPENSSLFWMVSSSLSFGIGMLHVLGLKQMWWKL